MERRSAEHDRRMRMLVVTERGMEVRTRMEQAMREVPSELAELSIDDQHALRGILQRALG